MHDPNRQPHFTVIDETCPKCRLSKMILNRRGYECGSMNCDYKTAVPKHLKKEMERFKSGTEKPN